RERKRHGSLCPPDHRKQRAKEYQHDDGSSGELPLHADTTERTGNKLRLSAEYTVLRGLRTLQRRHPHPAAGVQRGVRLQSELQEFQSVLRGGPRRDDL